MWGVLCPLPEMSSLWSSVVSNSWSATANPHLRHQIPAKTWRWGELCALGARQG